MTSECPGCGLMLPAVGGPTHPYVPTSPECWALFGRTAAQIGHRLLSDAYMAQHPDGDDPRQLQSVTVHLITLQAILGDGQPITTASRITARAVQLGKVGGGYPKLERPTTWKSDIRDVADGNTTAHAFIVDVRAAWDVTEGARIREWTRATLESLYA